jgi:hypothetical protein
MKFFPPELWERWQSCESAAEEDWENALDRYAGHLQGLTPDLPVAVQEFSELLLHDAEVESLAVSQGRLTMVLQTDARPKGLVVLDYTLASEPEVVPYARNPRDWGRPMRFDFDELDREANTAPTVYTQAIVLDNGWELRLRFHEVKVTRARPVNPAPAPVITSLSQPSTLQTQ